MSKSLLDEATNETSDELADDLESFEHLADKTKISDEDIVDDEYMEDDDVDEDY